MTSQNQAQAFATILSYIFSAMSLDDYVSTQVTHWEGEG